MKSKEKSISKRNDFIDFIRGIAIYTVVLGHTILWDTNSDFFDNNLVIFICSFHMPLFMAISGYCSRFGIDTINLRKIVKRIISLIIPIIVWGTINYLYNSFGNYNIYEWIIAITAGGKWFLYAIIFCYLVLVFIYNSKKRNVLCFIIFIMCLLLCEFIKPMRMITFMYPFYFAGFYIYECDNKGIKYRICEIVLCVLFPLLLLFYNRSAFIYTSGMAVLKSEYGSYQIIINIYRYLIGFSGIGFVLLFARKIYFLLQEIKASYLERLICDFGKNSLMIYVVSDFIIAIGLKNVPIIFNIQHHTFYTYFVAEIVAFMIVLFCFLIAKVINKNKLFSFILWGR